MAFHPENDLERALAKAVTDPSARADFYRTLAQSDLFVIQEGPLPEESGRRVLESGYHLQVRSIEHEGRMYLPVFSSLRRLQEVLNHDAGYIAMNAIEFMKITQGSALLLNPGSAYGKEFTSEEVQQLITGELWQPKERYTVERDTRVLIGTPERYPTELVDILSRVFARFKAVRRAYVAHFFNPSRDEAPHTLIAIDAESDWDRIAAEAGIAISSLEIPDPPVDFIQLDDSELREFFLSEKPFYERKRFSLFSWGKKEVNQA